MLTCTTGAHCEPHGGGGLGGVSGGVGMTTRGGRNSISSRSSSSMVNVLICGLLLLVGCCGCRWFRLRGWPGGHARLLGYARRSVLAPKKQPRRILMLTCTTGAHCEPHGGG